MRRSANSSSNSAGARRRATNLSIDATLLKDAKKIGVNLSRAAEEGVAAALARARAAQWLAENQKALDSSNDFVKQHGLPLAKYRHF